LKNTRSHSSSIGLDIRLNEIRFIHLRYISNTPRIEAIECIALPAHAIVEGRIKLPESVIQTLRTLVQKTHTQHLSTCMTLPAQGVISKRFQWLKKLTSKEQKRQAEEQLVSHFPGFSHELCYDYNILSELDDSHENVLLVATRQEQLNDYIHVAERAELSVKIIDVDTYALARAVRFVMAEKCDFSQIAILHVELNSVLFIVMNDNEIMYHSCWNDNNIEQISTKLNNAIQVFYSTYPQLPLNDLYISGEAEQVADVLPKIQNAFNMKINRLRLFQEVNVNPAISLGETKNFSENMMVCFGAALRRMPKW
jgi:Tfp pilus assembly PilM family ATPase